MRPEGETMEEPENYLHDLQRSDAYQLAIRGHSHDAAEGILTLLVTINVGAFVTVIELLESHHWLLILFAISTVAAILARAGIYYIYRAEVTMFEYASDLQKLKQLFSIRSKWWVFAELSGWVSAISFILGVFLLTAFFVYQ